MDKFPLIWAGNWLRINGGERGSVHLVYGQMPSPRGGTLVCLGRGG